MEVDKTSAGFNLAMSKAAELNQIVQAAREDLEDSLEVYRFCVGVACHFLGAGAAHLNHVTGYSREEATIQTIEHIKEMFVRTLS